VVIIPDKKKTINRTPRGRGSLTATKAEPEASRHLPHLRAGPQRKPPANIVEQSTVGWTSRVLACITFGRYEQPRMRSNPNHPPLVEEKNWMRYAWRKCLRNRWAIYERGPFAALSPLDPACTLRLRKRNRGCWSLSSKKQHRAFLRRAPRPRAKSVASALQTVPGAQAR